MTVRQNKNEQGKPKMFNKVSTGYNKIRAKQYIQNYYPHSNTYQDTGTGV